MAHIIHLFLFCISCRLIAKEMVRMQAVQLDTEKPVSGLWKKMNRFLELSPSGFPNDPDKHKQ